MNKGRDEMKRNRLEIDAKLIDRHIPIQVTFMNTAKGTQEGGKLVATEQKLGLRKVQKIKIFYSCDNVQFTGTKTAILNVKSCIFL